jgi:hypothetical protein
MSTLKIGPDPYGKLVAFVLVFVTISASSELFSFVTVTGMPPESLGANVPSPA